MLPCLTTSPHPMHRGASGVPDCGFVAYLLWPSSICIVCAVGHPLGCLVLTAFRRHRLRGPLSSETGGADFFLSQLDCNGSITATGGVPVFVIFWFYRWMRDVA